MGHLDREDTVLEQSGSEFIRGILWGAKEYLSKCSELISAQADAWLTLAGVIVLLIAVGLIGCLVPVRRGLSVQPTEALRTEG